MVVLIQVHFPFSIALEYSSHHFILPALAPMNKRHSQMRELTAVLRNSHICLKIVYSHFLAMISPTKKINLLNPNLV